MRLSRWFTALAVSGLTALALVAPSVALGQTDGFAHLTGTLGCLQPHLGPVVIGCEQETLSGASVQPYGAGEQSETGSLSQLSGALGCIAEDPSSVGDTCAQDSLDSGVELDEARSVAAYDGYVFVSGDDSADNNGIVALKAEAGGLTPVACITSAGDGGHCATAGILGNGGSSVITDLVVSPTGHLYATLVNGAIAVFSFNTGTDTFSSISEPAECVSDSGEYGCTSLDANPGHDLVFSSSGAYAYSAGDTVLWEYSVNASTGALTTDGCVGCGESNPGDIAAPGSTFKASGVALAPGGTHIYVSDGSEYAVWMFDITSGVATLPDMSTDPSDYCVEDTTDGPSDLCSASVGGMEALTGGIAAGAVQGTTYVYAVSGGEFGDGVVSEFSSTLGHIGCISNDGTDEGEGGTCQTGYGLYEADDPQLSPDGENLYVSGGYEDNGDIVQLAINPNTGALSEDADTGGSGGEDDCYVDGNTNDPSETQLSDCVSSGFEGMSGIDANGDSAGAFALSPTAAPTVSPQDSELYVAADDGVADLSRYTGRLTVGATIDNSGGGPGGNVVTASSTDGDANCSGASCTVDAGDTVTLTAAPASGYEFYDWVGSGDPCLDVLSTTCTVSDVSGQVAAIAEFLYLQPPTVSDYTETALTDTSEQITADLATHALGTTYSLEYGRSTSYSNNVDGGTYAGATKQVTFTLTGLTPGTSYHFDIIASNSVGPGDGGDATFTTEAAPPPLNPPAINDVTGALTGLSSATVDGTINQVPDSGVVVKYYVEYATNIAYTKNLARYGSGSDPYTNKTAVKSKSESHNQAISVTGVLGSLTGLSAGTLYDFRVVATSNITTTVGYSANQQIATPPPGPVVNTLPATSVSSTGATLEGTIDDMGNAGSYTFSWSASYPGAGGCSGSTAGISGSFKGTLPGKSGTQDVADVFSQQLPSGSRVSYTLAYDTTVDGFPADVIGGTETFSTGSFTPGGSGTAVVLSSSSAELTAAVPSFSEQPEPGVVDPVSQYGTDSSGGIEFTGTDTAEYGLFQYQAPTSSSLSYTAGTYLGAPCGTLVTVTLTGLAANTVYGFSADQAYGEGTCPSSIPGPAYYDPAMPITNVDQVDGVDWCWIGSAQELTGYLNGGFGETDVGGTNYFVYQPDYPAFAGPYLPGTGGDQAYAPTVSKTGFFQTAATSAPSSPGYNGSGVSDGLGCLVPSACSGTQTLKYSDQAATGAIDRARAHTTRHAVVLGSTKFSIRGHEKRRLRIRLSAAGRRYLRQHPKIVAITLQTVVRAGKGKPVTLTQFVRIRPLVASQPRKRKSKKSTSAG